MLYADQTLNGASRAIPMPLSASVFPLYSARVFKEALAVVGVIFVVVALGMLGTLIAQKLFAASGANAACTVLDQMSLLTPWCSALI